MNEELATFWQHAEDLRRTLLRIIFVVSLGFIASFLFYKPLIQYLIQPAAPKGLHILEVKQKRLSNPGRETVYRLSSSEQILEKSDKITEVEPGCYLMPKGESLLLSYTETDTLKIFSPLEGMVATLKITLWSAIALTSPIWLYMILTFVAPALKRETSRLLPAFWLLATSLFFAGLSFAWSITIPWANHFLAAFNQDVGENLWGFSLYLDYTLTLLLATGLAFESASVLLFLVHFGKLTANHLKKKRRHAIVAIFIISAILTPPDVFTQILLAIPLMGLYEGVIFYALICARKQNRADRDRLTNCSTNPQFAQTLPTDL